MYPLARALSRRHLPAHRHLERLWAGRGHRVISTLLPACRMLELQSDSSGADCAHRLVHCLAM